MRLCFLLLISLIHSRGEDDFEPILKSGHPGNPGVKFRLQEKGFEYINQVGARILKNEVPKIDLPDISRKIPGDRGLITLRNNRIVAYKPGTPKLETLPQKSIVWSVSGMNVRVMSKLGGYYNFLGKIKLAGDLQTTAVGVNLRLTSALEEKRGRLRARVTRCQSRISKLDIHVYRGGDIGNTINAVKQFAINEMKPIVEKELCKMARKFIKNYLNGRLEQAAQKKRLSELTGGSSKRYYSKKRDDIFSVISDIHKSDKLWLDYLLVSQPYATKTFLQSSHTGEITGRGKTPFGPTTMLLPLGSSKKMATVYISDFLPNSLLYHAYKENMLLMNVNPETEQFGQFMRTSCYDEGLEFCLGDLIPELAEKYPDHKTEIYMVPRSAPSVFFYKINGGTLVAKSKGILLLYVRIPSTRRLKHVLSLDVDVKASGKLWISDDRIKANVKFEDFHFRKRKLSMDVSDETIEDFQDLAEDIVESLLNKLLKEGFPLPPISGVKMKNPEAHLYSRVIQLTADFEVDEEMFIKTAKKALADGLKEMARRSRS